MKNIFSVLAVAFFIAGSLSSCSKDFECHCEFSDGREEKDTYEGIKKKDAEELCEGLESFYRIAEDPDVHCHLD
jgi:hypothetical protein